MYGSIAQRSFASGVAISRTHTLEFFTKFGEGYWLDPTTILSPLEPSERRHMPIESRSVCPFGCRTVQNRKTNLSINRFRTLIAALREPQLRRCNPR
jgi:hypothetical protein